ncbi:hypothetical protein FOA52_010930 [Chlamydomonas sp. UWO 241]|nr:hypothetical protein FOA52_010930 [Chlamydomonas sp. UWO 241]
MTEMVHAAGEEWVPAQDMPQKPEEVQDFRKYFTLSKGYKEKNKRKLDDDYERNAEEAEQQAAGPSGMDVEDGAQQAVKRRKAEGAAYIPVYEKQAKLVVHQRSSKTMKAVHKTSWERKMAIKADRKQYVERKTDAAAEIKERKKAENDRRREVKAKKEANREKSSVVQAVSTTTAKRMMKNRKQKKLLRKADTNPKTLD